MKPSFSEQYEVGQLLSLQKIDGTPVTQAIVVDYDPIADNWSHSGASKSTDPSDPNHWHVAVKDTITDEWLPAAIWEDPCFSQGIFSSHMTRNQYEAERLAQPLIYSNLELKERIYKISQDIASIVPIQAKLG